MGRSLSYSIVNHNMYQILANYMKGFAQVMKGTSRWLCVIAKNPELIRIIKNELSWPFYPEDEKREAE